MKRMLICLGTACVLALSGCASVPMGDKQQDAALKAFVAKPDVAGVYIYRSEGMGATTKMGVEIDGNPVGATAAKTFLYAELPPGQHTIVSRAENESNLSLEAEVGKLYYVWQEVKMGVFSARSELQLVDEKQGQDGVRKTRLAAPAPQAK